MGKRRRAEDRVAKFLFQFVRILRMRFLLRGVGLCHTQFLRPKPDAHRMYAQDQVVIHTVRM
jgi:hypothetical protein